MSLCHTNAWARPVRWLMAIAWVVLCGVWVTVCSAQDGTGGGMADADAPPALAPAAGATEDSWLNVEGGRVVKATDYPDLNAAVDALKPPGGLVILPPGTYRLKRTLNLADTYGPYAGKNVRRISLIGSGSANTIVTGDLGDQPLVDATNCARMRIQGLSFTGNSRVIWLVGRRNYGGGGGSVFQDVSFKGGENTQVVVAVLASECNRFYCCTFETSAPDSIAIAFTPTPHFSARGIDYRLTSPYVGKELTGGSNTVLSIHGSMIHSSGYNSIGFYAKGSTGDISISDCYNFNLGFASFYLDGGDANVSDTNFNNIRIEGGRGGLYCLYATGNVRNVTIDGGCWNSAGEIIRYESGAPDKFANNWRLNAKAMGIADNLQRDRTKSGTSRLLDIPPGPERAAIRADRMMNWRIDLPATLVGYQRKVVASTEAEKPGAQVDQATTPTEDLQGGKPVWYVPKVVVCSGWAKGNTIAAEKLEQVVLPIDPENNLGNRIEIMNDDGVRRTYLGSGSIPEILNLPPLSLAAVKAPKAGDFVLSRRPDGSMVPAYFNGSGWMELSGSPAQHE